MQILKRFLVGLAVLIAAGSMYYLLTAPPEAARVDTAHHYTLDPDWLQWPDSIILGNPTGISMDTSDNVVVFQRAGRDWPLLGPMPKALIDKPTVYILDRKTGKPLSSWGADRFIMPHGLTVDKENNIWLTDVGLHQVFKFTHDGKLVLKLGEAGVAGTDTSHFDKPTDIAIAADGSLYVSDGYGNSRVMQFSANGTFIRQWGHKGDGPGEFNVPHALSLDTAGNLYVADRENKRIQVFDARGNFLYQLASELPAVLTSVCYDPARQQLLAIDDLRFLLLRHRGSDLMVWDANRRLSTRIGRSGVYSGPRTWYHDLTVDREGNLYICDILGNRIQKFIFSKSK